MKKLISLIVAVVMVMAFAVMGTACKKNTDDKATIQQTGVIKIGMECNYKPFNWTQLDDSNGAVPISNVANKYANGYDVMIAKKIAEGLGVQLQVVMLEWNALVESLNSGLIDGIIAGMSPTAERKLVNDFSNPYYSSNLVVMCKAGSEIANATNLADLNQAKYKIAAQTGTFHYTALSKQLDKVQSSRVEDFAIMHTQLDSGLIDGYIAEQPTALTYCSNSTEYAYVALKNNDTGFTVTDDDVAISVGLRKGSNLLSEINEILAGITTAERDAIMNNAITWQANGIDD